MITAILLGLTLLVPQQGQAPKKNDPNGIWQSDTGTKFQLKLSGSDLKVQLVPNSSPLYLKYEVNLKNTGEVNTYEGSGYFVAKLSNGKECRFDTNWTIVVVQPELIAGPISHIIPDPETCEVKDRQSEFTQLTKSK
jgi:hypothetical protein